MLLMLRIYKYPEVLYQGTTEEEEISCLNKNGELEQINLARVRNCTTFGCPYFVLSCLRPLCYAAIWDSIDKIESVDVSHIDHSGS